jgi:hypothetical protein
MFSRMRAVAVTLLLLTVSCVSLHGQSENRSLCVAPISNNNETPLYCAPPGVCGCGKLSLRIDDRGIESWPKSESMKIDGLNATGKHRVVIFRGGKAQTSFAFSFANFKSPTPCLFLDGAYLTAQLWESKGAPWCKCH